MLRHLENQNYVTWIDDVRNTLYMYGFGIVWQSQGVGNEKAFIQTFQQRLKDCYSQNWHDSLQRHDFYSHYSSIMSSIGPHPYVSFVTNFYNRRLLARFRFGMTEIKGRSLDFKQLDITHRKCLFCNNVTENEYHMLLVCPKYSDIRTRYIPSKFTRFPTFHRFCILVASPSPHLIDRLCSFLKEAFQLRNDSL